MVSTDVDILPDRRRRISRARARARCIFQRCTHAKLFYFRVTVKSVFRHPWKKGKKRVWLISTHQIFVLNTPTCDWKFLNTIDKSQNCILHNRGEFRILCMSRTIKRNTIQHFVLMCYSELRWIIYSEYNCITINGGDVNPGLCNHVP